MRLLIATPLYPPDIGGPAKYAKALHEEFEKRGVSAPVVAYGSLERALPIGLRHLLYFFRLLPAIVQADAVLAFDTWSVGLPALFAAKLFGKKLAVRIGGDFLWELYVGRTKEMVRLSDFYAASRSYTFKERCIFIGTRFFIRHADALIFNTSWQCAIWQKAYGFTAEKAHVVENFFSRERDFSVAKGRVFVAAGREHPLKNHELLMRVFEKVKQDFPDIELDTKSLPPAEHHARVHDAYAVIVSSISEVNPNTAIDAIGAGKPFIMPMDSGGYELLKEAGVGIDTRNAAALELALRTLLDPKEYEIACARVRNFTYSHSWEEVADEFLILLR